MARPCVCDRVIGPQAPWGRQEDGGVNCKPCWQWHNDPAFRDWWGGPPLAEAALEPPCRWRGPEVGREQCPSCKGHVEVKLFACAPYGRCHLTARDVPGANPCRGCPSRSQDAPQSKIRYVGVKSANGIGDAVLALVACEGLRKKYPQDRVTLWCHRDQQREWVSLFHGYDELAYKKPAADMLDPHGHKAEQCRDRPRWEYYCEALGHVGAVLPEVRPLPADAVAWAEQYRGAVVVAPWTSCDDRRRWPYARWCELARLLREAGHKVVLIDDNAQRNNGDWPAADKLIGEPPRRVAALMRAASVVVGNDSGMAHVAGMLRAPALVLVEWHKGAHIYGLYPTVQVYQTSLKTLHAPTLARQVLAAREGNPLPPGPDHKDLGWKIRDMLPKLDTEAESAELGAKMHRRKTMEAALRHVAGKADPLVIETGCQRADNDWGAGMSTTLFGMWLAWLAKGRLHSVDNSPANVGFARSRAAGLPVTIHCADSRDWLREFKGPAIDLLYLDSADVGSPGFEECCLAEVEAALPWMAEDGQILIDDTRESWDGWRGKGRLAVPRLLAAGWEVGLHGYQVLLRRKGVDQ